MLLGKECGARKTLKNTALVGIRVDVAENELRKDPAKETISMSPLVINSRRFRFSHKLHRTHYHLQQGTYSRHLAPEIMATYRKPLGRPSSSGLAEAGRDRPSRASSYSTPGPSGSRARPALRALARAPTPSLCG